MIRVSSLAASASRISRIVRSICPPASWMRRWASFFASAMMRLRSSAMHHLLGVLLEASWRFLFLADALALALPVALVTYDVLQILVHIE